jgi:hypothetical protein
MANVDISLLADLLQKSMQQGHHPLLTVASNSMAPLLRHHDQVCVAPVTVAQLQPGDIITIAAESQLLTHRYWGTLTAREEVRLLTRGDRPLNFDTPWPAANLLGRVIARRRRGRDLSLARGSGRWLNHHLTWLATTELSWLTGSDKYREEERAIARPYTAPARLFRRLVYLWATFLTGVVGSATYLASKSSLSVSVD